MPASPFYRGIRLDEVVAMTAEKPVDGVERVTIHLRNSTSFKIYESWQEYYPDFKKAMDAWLLDSREHEIEVAKASQPLIHYNIGSDDG